jgi:hypothetical protein
MFAVLWWLRALFFIMKYKVYATAEIRIALNFGTST